MSVLITARIPKELKEELKKYGINISQVVRKALEEAVYKKKLEELRRYQEITRKRNKPWADFYRISKFYH